MPSQPVLVPTTYENWRRSRLGAITERLENELILGLSGPVSNRRWLDVGCGDGTFAELLGGLGATVTGVDSDPAMIETAAKRRRGDFLVASGEDLPFDDGTFECVSAITVLCLAGRREHMVAEMARVLKPGGHLIVGELGRFSMWALSRRLRAMFGSRLWQRSHFFTKEELTSLVEGAGLSVEAFGAAVYYPPHAVAARLFAPVDPILCRVLGGTGAAFIALSARKAGHAADWRAGQRPQRE